MTLRPVSWCSCAMYWRRTKSKGLQPAGNGPGGPPCWSCCSSSRMSDHVGIQFGLFARRGTHGEMWGGTEEGKVVVHLPERRLVPPIDAKQRFQARAGGRSGIELGELVLNVRPDFRGFLCRGALGHGVIPSHNETSHGLPCQTRAFLRHRGAGMRP